MVWPPVLKTVPGEPAHAWFTAMAWVFVIMSQTDATAVEFVKSSDSVSGEESVHHSPK